MTYEEDYKMWLEKMLIESNPDWVCDGMYDVGLTHEWCEKYCGEDSEYVTPKCLHVYYHHIARADRKTEPSNSKKPNNCTNCECTDDCSECKEAEHGSKDEPQIPPAYCKACKHDLWSTPRTCGKCTKQEDGKPSMYEPKDEQSGKE